jgi:hypothetical protein
MTSPKDPNYIRNIAASRNPAVIQNYLMTYGSVLDKDDIRELLRNIILFAPELIPMTDSMSGYYNPSLVHQMVQIHNVDLTPVIMRFTPEQIESLFIASLIKHRNDILNFIYSHGYRPSKDTLDSALADVLEIQSIEPSSKCLEIIQWLYQQGARISPGLLYTYALLQDSDLMKLLLKLLPEGITGQDEIEEIIQSSDPDWAQELIQLINSS